MIIRSVLLLCAWVAVAAEASSFIEKDVDLSFEEAVLQLKTSIQESGYTVRFVQPVDQGLRKRGHDIGDYRVILFDRGSDTTRLVEKSPELAGLLPLRVTVYPTQQGTKFSAQRLSMLANDPLASKIRGMLARWESDVQAIFEGVE